MPIKGASAGEADDVISAASWVARTSDSWHKQFTSGGNQHKLERCRRGQIHTETFLSFALASLQTERQERRSGLMSRNEASSTQVSARGFEGPHYCSTTAAACIIVPVTKARKAKKFALCGPNTTLTTVLRRKIMPFGPQPAMHLWNYLWNSAFK